MLSRLIAALALLSATVAFAAPLSPYQAASRIRPVLAKMDASAPWRVRLLGTSGAAVRPFRASNVHDVKVGQATLHGGGVTNGSINLTTGKVQVNRHIALAKGMPRAR